MRILILDIETAPNTAYVWRFFKENIGAEQVRENSTILSYAAKWLGDKKVFYDDVQDKPEEEVLRGLNALLDEADITVAHNGDRFDMPKIRGRSLVAGIPLPSPYKTVDTCLAARKQFGFESNSLKYLAKVLGCCEKDEHKKFPGFRLWEECLKGNKEAWKEMKKYNIQDIYTLEELYLKIRPYIVNHPNVSVFKDGVEVSCPKCGSDDSQKRGHYYTNVGKYQRFRCNSCGGWHRSRYTENTPDVRKALTTNAA